VRCGTEYSAEEVSGSHGWSPLRSGWRCPECSRAYRARIAKLAAALVGDHTRYDWLGTAEHSAWHECVFCDTLTAATALLLDAPPSRRPRG
jgi:rubredoxin